MAILESAYFWKSSMAARSFSVSLPFLSARAACSAEGGAGARGYRLRTSETAWR